MQNIQWQLSPSIGVRSYQLQDAAQLFASVERNRAYLRQWLPWLDQTTTISDCADFISAVTAGARDNSALVLGVWHLPSTSHLGNLSFNQIKDGVATIGYWLDQGWQGQGIITAACRLLIEYGFTQLNLVEVIIRVASTNWPSQAVASRLGFSHVQHRADAEWLYDHFVDHEVFSLRANDWAASFNA